MEQENANAARFKIGHGRETYPTIGDTRNRPHPYTEPQRQTASQTKGEQARSALINVPRQARQILRTIISNAVRYGGDRIQVTVDKGGSSVRLVVSNNGPGVPPEEQDRIFVPYHRAHTRTGLTASVGLDLTVSRKLARLMDGDLTYRCEPGASIFHLDLPKPN